MKKEKFRCSKSRKLQDPCEVWQSMDGLWEVRVLKKYQVPEKESTNPYARWYVATMSPYTHGSWEYGDQYVKEIKAVMKRVK